MRIITDVIFFFTNSIFCECFSITNLYTRIVERNNDFFKKTWIYPGITLRYEIEPTINKALIIIITIIITDPLRIAELSYLVYCPCIYSE